MIEFLRKLLNKRSSIPERRRSPRFHIYESLAMTLFSDGGKEAVEAVDLSRTGIRFASQKNFSPAQILNAELKFHANFAETQHLKVQLQVVRSVRRRKQTRYRTACVFVDLDLSGDQKLAQFIDWLKETNTKYLHNRYGDGIL